MVYLCSMTCSVIRYSNTSFITVRFEKCLNNWIWRTSWQSNSRWGNKVIYDFYKILAFGAWIVYYIGWIPLFCSQKPSIRPYAYSVTDMPSLLFSFFYSGLFYLLFVCTERSLLSLVTITDTHTHTHTVGFHWTKDRPVAETSAWQHKIFITERQPWSRRDSNWQTQEASSCWFKPQTARQPRSALFASHRKKINRV